MTAELQQASTTLLGLVALLALVLGGLWSAYAVAARLVGHEPPPYARACACIVVAFWSSVLLFFVLVSTRRFRLTYALVAVGVACVCVRSMLDRDGSVRRSLARDRAALADLVRDGWPARWLAAGAAVVVMARLFRGLVAPPLAWDALTYHLLKAGRWVQTGGWVTEHAPDAWGYYEYFPWIAEVPWAWAMLPFRSDAMLAPFGVAVWLAILAGAHGLARAVGATSGTAALCALSLGLVPASVHFLTACYAENLTLALLLLGSVFVVRTLDGAPWPEAALGAAALGLAAGTKLPAVAVLALGLLAVRRATWRPPTPLKSWLVALIVVGAAGLGMLPYVRAWVEAGSPVYPLAARVGPLLLPGNEELMLLLSGRLTGDVPPPMSSFLNQLFTDVWSREPHVNLGPAVPILMVAGCWGAVVLWWRGRRAVVAFLALSAVALALGVFSDSSVSLRAFWAKVAGRFLLPSACLVAIPAVVLGASRPILLGASVVHLALAMPRGWSLADRDAMLGLAASLGPGLVAALVFARRRPWGPALAAALLLLGLSAVGPIRDQFRHRIYAAAARPHEPAFDVHRLSPAYAASWPLWRAVDDGRPHRIAVSWGWDGIGHNAYRYPFLGRQLQNEVAYVPVTRSGEVLDYRGGRRLLEEADSGQWLARLRSREVEFVAALMPLSIEHVWLQAHPEEFEEVVSVAMHRLYRRRHYLTAAGRGR